MLLRLFLLVLLPSSIYATDIPVTGQVVDAKKEAERLRRATATGKAPTTGETPIIQRGRRAILQGIF